jgi:hypothetical protein
LLLELFHFLILELVAAQEALVALHYTRVQETTLLA